MLSCICSLHNNLKVSDVVRDEQVGNLLPASAASVWVHDNVSLPSAVRKNVEVAVPALSRKLQGAIFGETHRGQGFTEQKAMREP